MDDNEEEEEKDDDDEEEEYDDEEEEEEEEEEDDDDDDDEEEKEEDDEQRTFNLAANFTNPKRVTGARMHRGIQQHQSYHRCHSSHCYAYSLEKKFPSQYLAHA